MLLPYEPSCPSVGWSDKLVCWLVDRSVRQSVIIPLHFHAPTGALVSPNFSCVTSWNFSVPGNLHLGGNFICIYILQHCLAGQAMRRNGAEILEIGPLLSYSIRLVRCILSFPFLFSIQLSHNVKRHNVKRDSFREMESQLGKISNKKIEWERYFWTCKEMYVDLRR